MRARCEQLEQDIAVLSTAFHEVLADHHTDDSTFQARKEQYLRAAMEENKMIEAMLPHFLEVAGMKLSEPVPALGPVREALEKALRGAAERIHEDGQLCWCFIPAGHVFIHHEAWCLQARAALALAEEGKGK